MGMLVALFDRPLRQAAVSLGVSNTAMKSICRKLGLPRWPFQETRWQAARVTGKSPCSQTEPPSFDTAPSLQSTQHRMTSEDGANEHDDSFDHAIGDIMTHEPCKKKGGSEDPEKFLRILSSTSYSCSLEDDAPFGMDDLISSLNSPGDQTASGDQMLRATQPDPTLSVGTHPCDKTAHPLDDPYAAPAAAAVRGPGLLPAQASRVGGSSHSEHAQHCHRHAAGQPSWARAQERSRGRAHELEVYYAHGDVLGVEEALVYAACGAGGWGGAGYAGYHAGYAGCHAGYTGYHAAPSVNSKDHKRHACGVPQSAQGWASTPCSLQMLGYTDCDLSYLCS